MNVTLGIPLLIQEGGCAIKKKSRSHGSGADGVVGIGEVFQNAFLRRGSILSTTPSAPSKEGSRHLLDVASTPPISGGEWHAPQFLHTFYDRAYSGFEDKRAFVDRAYRNQCAK